jgi:hypothetical protein
MAEKGVVKGPGIQIIEMTPESEKEGVGVEHGSHRRKSSQRFIQLQRVSEEDESLARLVKPIQGK